MTVPYCLAWSASRWKSETTKVTHCGRTINVAEKCDSSAGHGGSSPAQCCVVSSAPTKPTSTASAQQPVQGVPVISRDLVCGAKQTSDLAGCAHCRDHPPQPFKIYPSNRPRQATAVMHCPSCHKDLPPDVEKVS